MAEIRAIGANSSCDVLGGVAYAYAADYTDIDFDDITVDASGVITDIGTNSAGAFKRLDFDDEGDVAFFNETGERLNAAATVYNGEGLAQFNGLDQDKITAAGLAGLCCGVVVIWVHYSGLRRVQGIDVNPSTQAAQASKKKAVIVPDLNSGTGAESEVLVYHITHQGRYPSATTNMDDATIEAL